jgi:hypothetical protein
VVDDSGFFLFFYLKDGKNVGLAAAAASCGLDGGLMESILLHGIKTL